ncbi:MAG: 16S rRNA processing protein RimM [Myxococcales bacterium]|nr:16S rRNA processing protein RimM [Myxococcales bacterium]
MGRRPRADDTGRQGGGGRAASPLVALGVVARPHGVHGELRVHPYNPGSPLLFEQDDVTLRQSADEGGSTWAVRRVREAPKAVLLTLDGCSSREAADALRGYEVCVPRDRLPALDEGELYFVDLLGAAVVEASTDGAARPVGEVVRVLEYPSADCLEVRCADGVREVPLLPRWVTAFDVEAAVVTVAALDELPVRPLPKGERPGRE